jgi:hypothetical protein
MGFLKVLAVHWMIDLHKEDNLCAKAKRPLEVKDYHTVAQRTRREVGDTAAAYNVGGVGHIDIVYIGDKLSYNSMVDQSS